MDGTVLSPTGNLISVFMQYRLGVFGFLPPSVAPTTKDPNFGTRDAILALQTVKENIGAAGGDPAKVTIGGQSAGAAMIRCTLWKVFTDGSAAWCPRGKGVVQGCHPSVGPDGR